MKTFIQKTLVLAILFAMVLSAGFSQQHKIDSIQQVIDNRSGIEKYDPLVDMVRLCVGNDSIRKSLPFALEASRLAYQYGDTLKIVDAARVLGIIFNKLGMYRKTDSVASGAIPIAKRNPDCKIKYTGILTSLGLSMLYQAKYDKALEVNFLNLSILEEQKNYEGLSICLNNIGVINYKICNYETALHYYMRSLRLKQKTKDDYDLDHLLVNIAICYTNMENLSKATSYLDSAMLACGPKGCSDFTLMDAYLCQGDIYKRSKQFALAEKYSLKSYKLAVKSKNTRFQLDNITLLCEMYLETNQLTRAVRYLTAAKELSGPGSLLKVELMNIYEKFFQVYRKTGNHERTAYYQQKYIELNDSIHNEDITNNLLKVQTEYLERENKVRIDAQQRVLLLNQEVINRQKIANVSIAIIAAMLALLAGLAIRSNRQKRRINLILDEKVKERTKQLEESHEALLQANREMSLTMDRSSSEVKSLMASIRGLCAVALKDISEPDARQYMIRMNSICDYPLSILKTPPVTHVNVPT